MPAEKDFFWKKKQILTYFMSVLVFFIHISSFTYYERADGSLSTVNYILSTLSDRTLARCAVPLYFILSGALFFRDYSNKIYWKKLKSRIFSLLIPFLCWNTIWMLFSIVTSYTPLSALFRGREKFLLTLPNVLEAIFHYSCNFPFWFVFELMFFVLISPVFDLLLRNKWVALGTVVGIFVLDSFGIGLPQWLFDSAISPAHFLLGGIIGRYYFDFFTKKSSTRLSIYAAATCILFIIVGFFTETGWLPGAVMAILSYPVVFNILMTLGALGLWFAVDPIIEKRKPRHIYRTSFFVYAMHINVSAVVARLCYMVLPRWEGFAIVNFLLTTVVTLVLIDLIYRLLERFFPWLLILLSGKRTEYKGT